MKGFAVILAAVFAGQAFATPAYSQQDKRAEGGDGAQLATKQDLFGTWITACPSLGIPQLYCNINVGEKCAGLYNDVAVKVAKQEMVKDDLKNFEADLKACAKLRDPATDAGLCYDQKLSGEACREYAKEFREKKKFILSIDEGEKPQEPSKAKPTIVEVKKTVQEVCTKRKMNETECRRAEAQCLFACARRDEVHKDCPRKDKQVDPTLDDISKCLQTLTV